VEELAQDIGRHFQHLPVKARPSTIAYRASRLVKRHKTEVSVAFVAMLALATATWLGFKILGLRDLTQTQVTTNSAEMSVSAAAISPSGKGRFVQTGFPENDLRGKPNGALVAVG